ncbi:MAG: amino acid aminotransferase [Lentisphaerae bacterium RIFOXYB12_FULL_65_16]|nr:MAG: amino acid aminotransferase [Lentisphaerae bacterium RIFOXYA12_64_32]OGV88522.1 MAG: amino acid aminotransferase [Lentisphaerae bacterium RIFOXYB12_FULL_65_16]
MAEATYYVNGKFVPASQGSLPLNDLAIVRGYGVFDLLRTYDRVMFRLRDHVLRLQTSAQSIGIRMPWSVEQIEQLIRETHDRNSFDNAAIRIVVTGGVSSDLMTPDGPPSLIIMLSSVKSPGTEEYSRGCKVKTVVMARERPTVKSLNYIGAIKAVEEAKKEGAVEALYRTADGEVTEGTRANFFIFIGRKLITPREGVLFGITRKAVLDLARDEFEVFEAPVRYDELRKADEAFLTSTTKEVLPVVCVDDITIGTGKPGPNTLRLLARFRDAVLGGR